MGSALFIFINSCHMWISIAVEFDKKAGEYFNESRSLLGPFSREGRPYKRALCKEA